MENTTSDNDQAEKAHWRNVMRTFQKYYKYVENDVARRQMHLNRLPREYADRLPPSTFEKLGAVAHASQANQDFFDEVVEFQDKDFRRKNPSDALDASEEDDKKFALNFGSQQHRNLAALHSIFREWSAEGRPERDDSFLPIVDELIHLLPINPENVFKQRILVPGCGLGRLPLEIAAAGYACQGNEFSTFMAMPSNFILNGIDVAESFEIYPWLDRVSNVASVQDVLQKIRIPDIAAADMLARSPFDRPVRNRFSESTSDMVPPSTIQKSGSGASSTPRGSASDAHGVVEGTQETQHNISAEKGSDPVDFPRFSMCLGDFVELYGDADNACFWDGVATCFFIDTAPVVVEYIDVIYSMLRPGGVWVNLGPLLYHWTEDVEDNKDPRFGMSVELSWEELRHVITSFGFEFERDEWRECCYTRTPSSMMWNKFRCKFFSVRKPLAAPQLMSQAAAGVSGVEGVSGAAVGVSGVVGVGGAAVVGIAADTEEKMSVSGSGELDA